LSTCPFTHLIIVYSLRPPQDPVIHLPNHNTSIVIAFNLSRLSHPPATPSRNLFATTPAVPVPQLTTCKFTTHSFQLSRNLTHWVTMYPSLSLRPFREPADRSPNHNLFVVIALTMSRLDRLTTQSQCILCDCSHRLDLLAVLVFHIISRIRNPYIPRSSRCIGLRLMNTGIFRLQ